MLDLKKKYKYEGHKMIDIYYYPETACAYNYLVVYGSTTRGVMSRWISAEDPRLVEVEVEVKPEPAKVTRWFNVYKPLYGDSIIHVKDRAHLSKREGYECRSTIGDNYIGTFPMEITFPVEDE